MKVKIFPITILLAFFLFVGAFTPAASLAADVDVYIKGAFTDTYLDVFVFADINVDRLISWGVTLNYDVDELNPISAEKNPDPVPYTSNQGKWELGSDAATKDLPNPDFTSVAGKVIGKGGVLNEADPTAGNTGTGVLLFKVRFEPGLINPNLSAPTLTLGYAVGNGEPTEDYKNFVRYDPVAEAGVVLDSTDSSGVEFHAPNLDSNNPPMDIAEYGDANGNGTISLSDARIVRNIFLGNSPSTVLADCNENGMVSLSDARCIRDKFLNP